MDGLRFLILPSQLRIKRMDELGRCERGGKGSGTGRVRSCCMSVRDWDVDGIKEDGWVRRR